MFNQYQPYIEQYTQQLNAAKDSLNIPQFERLKKAQTYEEQIRQLRRQTIRNANAQHVTRAWLKMYEMLTQTPLGESLPANTKAFFNAELPGGFVFATNHYLKTHGKNLSWLIASFQPRTAQEKYIGDIFGIMQANPDKTLSGRISTNRGVFWSTGDLTDKLMTQILAQLAGPGTIDLYTADGGFDVTGRENLQETLSLPLIQGEINTGMQVLKVGGNMVLKIFTFFTPEMWANLVRLMRAFNNYTLYKPTTSNPLNSEVYFIGLNFMGDQVGDVAPEQILNTLSSAEANFIWQNMQNLVGAQINAINAFLQQQALPAPVELTPEPLAEEDYIATNE